jgi:hypothetical protein
MNVLQVNLRELIVSQVFLVMKLGSPAVQNGSPRQRASAIFNPCLIFGAIVEICIAHLCDAFFFLL